MPFSGTSVDRQVRNHTFVYAPVLESRGTSAWSVTNVMRCHSVAMLLRLSESRRNMSSKGRVTQQGVQVATAKNCLAATSF